MLDTSFGLIQVDSLIKPSITRLMTSIGIIGITRKYGLVALLSRCVALCAVLLGGQAGVMAQPPQRPNIDGAGLESSSIQSGSPEEGGSGSPESVPAPNAPGSTLLPIPMGWILKQW